MYSLHETKIHTQMGGRISIIMPSTDTHFAEVCVENLTVVHIQNETAVAQWSKCCATNRKVTGSIPDGVIGIFH